MKTIKCSRCKNRKSVPDDWKYQECGKCHERTVRRFPKIRQYTPREFKIDQLFNFPSFEEFAKTRLSLARKIKKKRIPLTKELKESLRKEYEDAKLGWIRANSTKIAELERLFHIREYPIHSEECLKVRTQARKHYLDGEEWEIEVFANHFVKCKDCNGFVIALKNGELIDGSEPDPTEEARLRQEDYSSLKEWKENMDAFGETITGKRDRQD